MRGLFVSKVQPLTARELRWESRKNLNVKQTISSEHLDEAHREEERWQLVVLSVFSQFWPFSGKEHYLHHFLAGSNVVS